MTSRPRIHLDVLEVREPCTEDWSRMHGNERERFCATCENDVYDLSKMTLDEAEALLSRDGRVCVRFYRRADGTVTTLDCAPRRFEAVKKRTRRALALAAAMVASTVGAIFGLGLTIGDSPGEPCIADWVEPWPDEPDYMMGEPAFDDEALFPTDPGGAVDHETP